MKIIDYCTSGGKNIIVEYIENLPDDLKTKAYLIRSKIELDGFDALKALEARKLRGKLYEIKFSNQRLMYVIQEPDKIYFVHMCKKEKMKTKSKGLNVAIQRTKELGYVF